MIPFFVPSGHRHNYYLRLSLYLNTNFYLSIYSFLNTITCPYSFYSSLQLNSSSVPYGTILNVYLKYICFVIVIWMHIGVEMIAGKEEASVPWQGKEAAIHGAVAGKGHKHRHRYREVPHQLLCKGLWQVETVGAKWARVFVASRLLISGQHLPAVCLLPNCKTQSNDEGLLFTYFMCVTYRPPQTICYWFKGVVTLNKYACFFLRVR